jgi:lysophospholipid acyltransferase (LPLAT)-like uncharacterized protein
VFEKGSMMAEGSPKSNPDQSRARVRRPKSGVVVPHAPTALQRIGAWLVFILVRTLAATYRCRWNDRSGYFDTPPSGPMIYCMWHNRLVLCGEAYRQFKPKRGSTSGIAAMVSASRDGGFLTAILECFKMRPVRGSSSRRGPQALLEMATLAGRGYDLAITPDGPRGPRYLVQDGVMSLAQVTGLPIVPFSFFARRKICLKSWDGFQIPLPFSRCELNAGKPIRVPREATDGAREELRRQLEQALKEISPD